MTVLLKILDLVDGYKKEYNVTLNNLKTKEERTFTELTQMWEKFVNKQVGSISRKY